MSLPEENKKAGKGAAREARHAYGRAAAATPEEGRIVSHLPLVKSVVDRFKMRLPSQVDFDDLYSAGLSGLIVAARKFDPEQANVFEAYARRRIHGAVLDELRRMDPLPRSARQKTRQVEAAVAALEQRLGRPAEAEEVANQLGVSGREYERILEQIRPLTFLPLDLAHSEEDGRPISLHEVIPDETQPRCGETLERRELIQVLADRIEALPERQKQVVVMYYHEEMRLAEIAAVFGVTEARICQIHSQALTSLRSAFAAGEQGAEASGRGGGAVTERKVAAP